MSMHPDIRIVCTYIQCYGLPNRPDDHNTLTRQSTDTNDAPRDPLDGPVTWNPARFKDLLRLRLWLRIRTHIYLPPLWYPPSLRAHRRVTIPPIWSAAMIPVIGVRSFLVTFFYLIWITIFDLIRFDCGFDWINQKKIDWNHI